MKRMLPLKALRSHLYGTRRLEAGDEYEAPVEEAIAMVANRRADFIKGRKLAAAAVQPAPEPVPAPSSRYAEPEAPPPEPAETPTNIDALRLQATQLGVDVDGRWGAPRLRHEIELAQGKTLMRIFGRPVPFTGEKQKQQGLTSVTEGRGGWFPIVREPFTGAWQRNITINNEAVAAFHADFACKTLIARDIAKLRVKLVEEDSDGIWTETTNPAFSPVLRQPNDYQTRNQFWESWLLSKLSRGNTYVLKVRDARNVVTAMHVLDPTRVQPLVAVDGSVFYRLSTDYLAGLETEIVVPAREIIHDRFNCMFHPLVGTPPVFASGLASMLGLNAQKTAALLFENNSTPGGILTAPGEVSEVEEKRIKEEWEQRFSRVNIGRVAVLSGGMQYQKMPLTAVETQMVEQLKWSAETVCSVYHVPPYKVSIDVLPRGFTNLQALNVEYYSQSLQSFIEEIEELLDDALGIGEAEGLGTEFDTDNLLRMDSIAQVTVIKEAVGAGVMTPNEGRARFDLTPVIGGDSPMMQQQNYSLEALAKRDAQADPFAPATPPAPPPPTDQVPPADKPAADAAAAKSINLDRVGQLFARAA